MMAFILRIFSPSSKKAEIGPFTQLLNNNGVEIIETANDGNCFYDAFYRSILTIETDDLKNRIFDPILNTLKNEDLPNLRVPQATIGGDARKEYIKKVNPGAFTNATPVISEDYNDSAKAQGQARLFKQCQTLFIRCCRRYVANNLTFGSLSMINEALCSQDPDTYEGVYQSSIKPFLDKILQCPYNETTNMDNQLIVYQNAVKMINGGRVDSGNTGFKDLRLTSPVWAGQPEMSILQEKLGIKLLNFKLEKQNNLTSTFQTLGGANINDDTVYVPLAYNGFHFQTLAVKTHKGEKITYQSASGFDTLPPVLQMLDCFQFKGLKGAPSRNECQLYTKIKDILELNEQIRKYLSTNYDLILSDSVERITQGYQQFQTNIGILSWTDQLEILNKLLPFFTNCSRLKSVEDLKACQVNNGQPYSDARASILAIVDRSIGNDMETITNYVKNQILNVKSDNFNNIFINLDELYNTLYPGSGLGSPSIFPQESPAADQPAAADANSVIDFVTELINTRIEELQQNIKENKAEPNNPVKATLKMIESVEEREQRKKLERKAAEEQAKREADRLAKETAEKEKKAEADKKAKEEEKRKQKLAKEAAAKKAKAAAKKAKEEANNQLKTLVYYDNQWNNNQNDINNKVISLTKLKSERNLQKQQDNINTFAEEEVADKAESNKNINTINQYSNTNNSLIKILIAVSGLINQQLRIAKSIFKLRQKVDLDKKKVSDEAVYNNFNVYVAKLKEPEDNPKNLVFYNILMSDVGKTENDTENYVLEKYKKQGIASPEDLAQSVKKLQKMNAEIRSLLLKITPDPYGPVYREQINLITGTIPDEERYVVTNQINRITQSIIAPYLEPPKGTISLSMTAKPEKVKAGGGKRRKKNMATRKSNAKKGGKPNSARGNRSGTRRRGRFARSRSLPRRKPAGNRDRSQKVRSKLNRRTRRSQRK